TQHFHLAKIALSELKKIGKPPFSLSVSGLQAPHRLPRAVHERSVLEMIRLIRRSDRVFSPHDFWSCKIAREAAQRVPMSTVAEQLRLAREARNLTVHQVADITKIRTDHIRALEEGNFDMFS